MKERSRLTFAVKNGNVIGGQSRLGLDTDQQGTSTSGSNAFSWEMNALETQRESTFLFKKKFNFEISNEFYFFCFKSKMFLPVVE